MGNQWLERKIVVYVPSTYKDKLISDSAFQTRITATTSFFTKEFGGTTRVKALGSWYDSDADRVVKERVAKVEVFLDAPIVDSSSRCIKLGKEGRE